MPRVRKVQLSMVQGRTQRAHAWSMRPETRAPMANEKQIEKPT
jgi:hypothetical protein